MPNFGDPQAIGNGEYIYTFTWPDWQTWQSKIKASTVPSRVLWLPKSGCLEKYRIVPTDPPDTPD